MESWKNQLWTECGCMIVTLDLHGRMTFANQEALASLECCLEDLIGRDWVDTVVCPEQQETVRGMLMQILAGKGEPFRQVADYEMVSKNGKRRSVAWTKTLIKDEQGIITGVISMGQDITDRKLAELCATVQYDIARIMDETSLFAEAISGFLQVIGSRLGWDFGEIWSCQADNPTLIWGSCWYADNADCQTFDNVDCDIVFKQDMGMPCIVKSAAKPIWIEDVTQHPNFSDNAMAQQTGIRSACGFPVWVAAEQVGVIVFFSKDKKPADNSLLTMFEALGIQIGTYCQYKQIETVSCKRERILDTGSRIARLGSWEWDLCSNQKSWSAELFRILGYEPDEVVPTYDLFLEALVPQDRERVAQAIQHAADSRGTYELECEIQLPDGQNKFIHCQGEVVCDGGGNAPTMLGTAMDITERRQTMEELAASEQRFRDLIWSAPDALIIIDDKGRILLANEQSEQLFGYSEAELQGQLVEKLLPKRYASTHVFQRDDYFKNHSNPKRGKGLEFIGCRQDGSEFPIEVSLSPLETKKGIIVSAAIRDISERKRVEQQLRLWAELFKNSGEAILVTDAAGVILTVNDAFVHMTGYLLTEVVGKNPNVLKSGRHTRAFFQTMWAALHEAGYWHGEIWDKRKNGEIYPKWSTISRIKDAQGVTTHYIATYLDITERKVAEDRIRFLAHYDSLTGLPNRELLQDRMNIALANAKRQQEKLAVLFIDLDRFKLVNDSLGHQAGDKLLRKTAECITGCLRDSDTICRMGGDEFVIIMPNVSEVSAVAALAQRIRKSLKQPICINDMELRITASIGISVYPEDGLDQDTLIKNADAAMYYCKDNGRNGYHFFTEDLNRIASERLLLESSLQRALERDEFLLYYQPQVDIVRNEVIGVEALIRWQQTDGELASPAKFIPVAEDTGLIISIGDWVLQEVCRQCSAWDAQGLPPLAVSVNISTVQFHQPDFVEKTSQAVKHYGVEPSRLEIEITEGVVMKDAVAAIAEMHKLKLKGFRLSIDDFGTGYSSLNYLSRFPIDKLKIDQTFVRSMMVSQTDMKIVESIITLGKNLNLRIIAEGVETYEELIALQERDCEEIQGYYFAKPMPADKFLAWWQERR